MNSYMNIDFSSFSSFISHILILRFFNILVNILLIIILIFPLAMNLTFHSFTLFSHFRSSVVLFKRKVAYKKTPMHIHMSVYECGGGNICI